MGSARASGHALRRHLAALPAVIWNNGAIGMSVAALVFSLSSLCVKLIHNRVPTFQIVAFRSSTSFIACALGARQAHIAPLFGHKRFMHWLLARGLFGAAAMSTYYLSISALPLADAVTLFFLNPAVTAIAAWLVMREPLGVTGFSGVGMSLVGLVVLSQPPFIFDPHGLGWDHNRKLGTAFGVLSALFAAGAFIAIRFIGKGEPALVMSVHFHTCAFVTSIIPLLAGIPERAVLPGPIDWLLLFGVAATSFWGQILIGRGFQLLTAAKAAAINFTQVVYSYLFGIVLLGEHVNGWGALGSALIAGGVILVNLRPRTAAVDAAINKPEGPGQGGVAAGSDDTPTKSSGVGTGRDVVLGRTSKHAVVEMAHGVDKLGREGEEESEYAQLLGPWQEPRSDIQSKDIGGVDGGTVPAGSGEGSALNVVTNGRRDVGVHEHRSAAQAPASPTLALASVQGWYDEEAAAARAARREGAGGLLGRMLGHMDSRIAVHHPWTELAAGARGSSFEQRLNAAWQEQGEVGKAGEGAAVSGAHGDDEGGVGSRGAGDASLEALPLNHAQALDVDVSRSWKPEQAGDGEASMRSGLLSGPHANMSSGRLVVMGWMTQGR